MILGIEKKTATNSFIFGLVLSEQNGQIFGKVILGFFNHKNDDSCLEGRC